jgi:PAS domain S-box-containing protein
MGIEIWDDSPCAHATPGLSGTKVSIEMETWQMSSRARRSPATPATSRHGWEELFWVVFERSSNPIFLLDMDRRVIEANEGAAEMVGGRQAVIGMPIEEAIRSPDPAQQHKQWDLMMRVGQLHGTRTFRRPDGNEIEVDFAAQVVNVEGRALVVTVILPRATGGFTRQAGAQVSDQELTQREREIVTLIALGFESGEIAKQLHISAATVRTHVRNAMARLHAHTRAQLVAVARCSGQLSDVAVRDAALGEGQ